MPRDRVPDTPAGRVIAETLAAARAELTRRTVQLAENGTPGDPADFLEIAMAMHQAADALEALARRAPAHRDELTALAAECRRLGVEAMER